MMPRMVRLLGDSCGISAVEFALIGPLLVFVALALVDAVNFAVAVTSMQRAERAGIQYFMNGGTSINAANGIVATAWKNRPSNYTVNAHNVCKCGDAPQLCGLTLCASGASYSSTMVITANGTVTGILTSFNESKSESVRVQ